MRTVDEILSAAVLLPPDELDNRCAAADAASWQELLAKRGSGQ